MSAWINFKELRAQLKFEDVLRHYKITAKRKGDRAMILCPLPGHPSRTDGKPRTASLSINFTRNIFRCFGCQQSGNALEFACRMEGYDPSKTNEFRQAALKIAEALNINAKGLGGDSKPAPTPALVIVATDKTVMNAPLDFELKDLDAEHPYLRDRGFQPPTIRKFGLGYCNRGLMKGRVAIPIHDKNHRLVGYAGRITKEEMISDECPKYRFPGSRLSKGVQHEFRKSLLLYNFHRVRDHLSDVLVVEGFASTWWLDQCGLPDVVALMGNSCSEEQAELIVQISRPNGTVWAMPDGNEAGIQCAHSIFEQVAKYRPVRWIRLEPDQQPTNCTVEQLHGFLD